MTEFCGLSFTDVFHGEYTLEQASRHPEYPQLAFLTAPANCACSDIDTDSFFRLLAEAKETFSYVFLDAPAGVEIGFQMCARYADRVILVTGADPASVRDAARAGQLLELMGKNQVRIIVNRVNEKFYSAVKVTVDDVMDRAGLPLLGIVPEDPSVTLAAAFGKPLLKLTKKGAAAACKRIAKRIQGLPVPIPIR